jgi:hypothetical protein
MRFSQRKCSSREVLQPLGGNPCPTAIPYQADRRGSVIPEGLGTIAPWQRLNDMRNSEVSVHREVGTCNAF